MMHKLSLFPVSYYMGYFRIQKGMLGTVPALKQTILANFDTTFPIFIAKL